MFAVTPSDANGASIRGTENNELGCVTNGEVVRAIIGHATEAMPHHYSHVGEDENATVRVVLLRIGLDDLIRPVGLAHGLLVVPTAS